MPYVMITARCQNSCTWCFARSKMEYYRSQGIEEMTWQDFLTVVQLYERSAFKQMGLLGGEPTTHSRFVDMLSYLSSRGFTTLVVTNGIIPSSLVDVLVQKRFPKVQFGFNSTSYFDYGPDTRRTIDYFLRNIPNAVTLSYTVTRRDIMPKNLHPILDRLFLITKFGVRPHMQLGIALPSHDNSDFVPFGLYQAAMDLLQSWIRVLQTNQVSVGLDCHCIPPCSLSPGVQFPFPLKSSCKDFMLDIGPNLDVWPCFPLSAQTFKLEQFQTLSELRAFFGHLGAADPLLYEGDCAGCLERLSKACDGGCRGFQNVRKASMSRMERGQNVTHLT
jgi:MoaA/NifB/PqqE/SkfB family radical SAM enzyme